MAANPFRVLGLEPTDDPVTIRAAFRAEARRWHPDLNDEPGAAEHFQRAEQAYQLLCDPGERRRAAAAFAREANPVVGLPALPSWEKVSELALAYLARPAPISLWPARVILALSIPLLLLLGDAFAASSILVILIVPRMLMLVLLVILAVGLLAAGEPLAALVIGAALVLGLVAGALRHRRAARSSDAQRGDE